MLVPRSRRCSDTVEEQDLLCCMASRLLTLCTRITKSGEAGPDWFSTDWISTMRLPQLFDFAQGRLFAVFRGWVITNVCTK